MSSGLSVGPRYAHSGGSTENDGALSVSDLIGQVSETIAGAFRSVTVQGEVSNLKRPKSGHLYFTLKDESAQLRCVMWRSNAARIRFRPTDGMAVRVSGGLGVYPSRGDLQMNVSKLAAVGEGDLQRAFAELGRRLKAEGLFDPARKRPLPRFPRTLGLITSGTGAAVQDMLSVIGRRYPLVRVVLVPVAVQGDLASRQIVGALQTLNRLSTDHSRRPEVILLGRGGGSLEDLWAFNEEPTVRAVHASGIPVIAGIGHEIDITLCDLVADVRASTPSMAAEIAVPDRAELAFGIQAHMRQHRRAVMDRLGAARLTLERAAKVRTFSSPAQRISRGHEAVGRFMDRLDRAIRASLTRNRLTLQARLATWEAANPLRPLANGFALIQSDGHRIVSASDVPVESPFSIRFRDGLVEAIRPRNEDAETPFIAPDSANDLPN